MTKNTKEHIGNSGDGSLGGTMRFRIWIAALAVFSIPEASAEKAVHFLIDASGSMQKRQDELHKAVDAKRKELADAGDTTPIETLFGGDNGGICGTAVVIGRTDAGEFREDGTQLGAALEAALLAVGDGPADIFIFTDEEQTSGCGPDICTVAERHLPKPGIFVQSVPINSSPYDHNRLSCIKSAQDAPGRTTPFLSWNIYVDRIDSSGEDSSLSSTINWSPVHFLEKWLWLIGFCCVAFSAVLWGQQRQKRAVQNETATTKLDRFRMAALVDGNEPARNQLRDEIKAINELRNEESAELAEFQKLPRRVRYRKRLWKFITELRWHWIGVFGLAILVLLPLLSEAMAIGDFSVGRAQRHAWVSLDSSFAEAFSLVAIAIVFFAGSQLRRYQESVIKYDLANEKANWAQVQLEAKQRSDIAKAYARAVDNVRGLKIVMPSPPFLGRRKTSRDAHNAAAINFAVVLDEARKIAEGAAPDLLKDDLEKIAAEIDAMNQIATETRSWLDPLGTGDTARFFESVLKHREDKVPVGDRDLWSNLIQSLRKSSYSQASVHARELATALLVKPSQLKP